jgi:hypothetical protein
MLPKPLGAPPVELPYPPDEKVGTAKFNLMPLVFLFNPNIMEHA